MPPETLIDPCAVAYLQVWDYGSRLCLGDQNLNILAAPLDGTTPLHDAVANNHLQVAQLLVSHGGKCRQHTAHARGTCAKAAHSRMRTCQLLSEKLDSWIVQCGRAPSFLWWWWGRGPISYLLGSTCTGMSWYSTNMNIFQAVKPTSWIHRFAHQTWRTNIFAGSFWVLPVNHGL